MKCPEHGIPLRPIEGRFWCGHVGHDGRPRSHALGYAPRTQSFFDHLDLIGPASRPAPVIPAASTTEPSPVSVGGRGEPDRAPTELPTSRSEAVIPAARLSVLFPELTDTPAGESDRLLTERPDLPSAAPSIPAATATPPSSRLSKGDAGRAHLSPAGGVGALARRAPSL